jgi:hypothetical protein
MVFKRKVVSLLFVFEWRNSQTKFAKYIVTIKQFCGFELFEKMPLKIGGGLGNDGYDFPKVGGGKLFRKFLPRSQSKQLARTSESRIRRYIFTMN